jgi:hypothetical protein
VLKDKATIEECISSQLRTGKGMFDWGSMSCGIAIEGKSFSEMKAVFDDLAEVFGEDARIYLEKKPIRALTIIDKVDSVSVDFVLAAGFMMDHTFVTISQTSLKNLSEEQKLKLGRIMGSYQKE